MADDVDIKDKTEAIVHSRGWAIDIFELKLAREVERLLFPKSSSVCTWNCIGVKNRMAGVLGGDYFDFITLSDSRLAIFIGDVTGHGLHASLVMSLLYGFIHHAALGSFAPSEIAVQANSFLGHFADRSKTLDQYFSSTLFLGIINPATLLFDYVNAGHVPVFVKRKRTLFELVPTAQPLGYFATAQMESRTFRLQKGDRLLFYTDGIVEASNPSGVRFGPDRLKKMLLESRAGHRELLDQLFASLHDFGISDPPEDDCTALVVDIRNFVESATGK